MARFSYRVLAASAFAAGLVGAVAINGCGSTDCNDTATCSSTGDAFASTETATEASDELLPISEAAPDTAATADTGGDVDMTADADSAIGPSDVTVDAGDVSVDADAAASDMDVHDASVDVPPDVGVDVGIDAPKDVGIDVPPMRCVSNPLAPTNEVASSVNNANVAAGATDGIFTTRWESTQGVDPQWIYLDFGSPVFMNRVRIQWETACGKNYDLQTSNDAMVWSTMKAITNNNTSAFAPTDWTGAVDHTGFTGVGRYLRIYGTARCTINYGYSIWEMQVYGDPNPACKP